MQLLITIAIVLLLVLLIGTLLISNKSNEESAKAKHEPKVELLSPIRVAIEYNTNPIERVRGSPN